MPYQPILNPQYFHWEPWPHVYRRGGWINNVTAYQSPTTLPYRSVVPGGLGETPPWQCWEQPGFKECQAECFKKAQSTGVSADAQAALVDQCFSMECIAPCRAKLPAKAPDSTTASLDSILAKATPINIALVAVAIAIGSSLLFPPKKGKKGSRT